MRKIIHQNKHALIGAIVKDFTQHVHDLHNLWNDLVRNGFFHLEIKRSLIIKVFTG
jgi:hypothetical protein